MNRVRNLIHAERTYQMGYSGRHVGVALLDSGIAEHIDLEGRTVVFRDFINGRTAAYDDNGHGTHVAGIVAGSGKACGGSVCGIAPRAELVVLKVLDSDGNGETADVLRALAWVSENRVRYHIRILNFSVGFLPNAQTAEQQKLLTALDQLWDEGVMVVTAAGNRGPRAQSVTVPGISRKVLTVGASDDDAVGNPNLKRGYSGRGPTNCCIVKPEILAPGTQVLSCSAVGNGYVYKSGTSMAAPVVSGALALAMERFPGMTPAEWKLRLYETVMPRGAEIRRNSWGILHVDRLLGFE